MINWLWKVYSSYSSNINNPEWLWIYKKYLISKNLFAKNYSSEFSKIRKIFYMPRKNFSWCVMIHFFISWYNFFKIILKVLHCIYDMHYKQKTHWIFTINSKSIQRWSNLHLYNKCSCIAIALQLRIVYACVMSDPYVL